MMNNYKDAISLLKQRIEEDKDWRLRALKANSNAELSLFNERIKNNQFAIRKLRESEGEVIASGKVWIDCPIDEHIDYIEGVFIENKGVENLSVYVGDCTDETEGLSNRIAEYKDKNVIISIKEINAKT